MVNSTDYAHLIVFGRYPRVGMTKTRLIPALGPAGAAALQKRLAEKTMATAREVTTRIGARLVFCHDGGNEKQLRQWLGGRPIRYVAQADGDLGWRMHLALKSAFDGGARRVVLVGTDIPGLTTGILNQAFNALQKRDLVVGPSTDGGYWLVGMKRPENIFEGITWSQRDVLEKTLAVARDKGMTSHLLEPLNDLDTPDDLAMEKGANPPLYLSVVIPAIDEARQLARTIATATSPDAEIIVSDGGSKDRTVQIASSLGARIVSGEPGRAGQQNRGAAAARGEVLLFLHADTRLPGNYVDHVFETLMDRRTLLGAFRFATDIHTPAMRSVAFFTNLRAGWLNLPYGDQALFMRKDDFDAAGGFPDVPIAEDLHLVRRMARNGHITLAPAAAVTSGRRWQHLGTMRTTIINAIIAVGSLAGIAPWRLARLYRLPAKKTKL
ncbi:TIGR04283 family arsenosugar biosynthesis glycosyltransferase [uncultured Desulfosarcina sp.]|uniref:TIGR04283 family arsenosugar biosynthesis glycosyltransferase n=1 Tax=uncultured Desulfosarcina sp. TaxID=218289 RepID=UPI0029C914A5|nr:TIGR04283 family arsenosugar biosynthesis glycosyltransferase [uncultured Desulfosarcina sp.]